MNFILFDKTVNFAIPKCICSVGKSGIFLLFLLKSWKRDYKWVSATGPDP